MKSMKITLILTLILSIFYHEESNSSKDENEDEYTHYYYNDFQKSDKKIKISTIEQLKQDLIDKYNNEDEHTKSYIYQEYLKISQMVKDMGETHLDTLDPDYISLESELNPYQELLKHSGGKDHHEILEQHKQTLDQHEPVLLQQERKLAKLEKLQKLVTEYMGDPKILEIKEISDLIDELGIDRDRIMKRAKIYDNEIAKAKVQARTKGMSEEDISQLKFLQDPAHYNFARIRHTVMQKIGSPMVSTEKHNQTIHHFNLYTLLQKKTKLSGRLINKLKEHDKKLYEYNPSFLQLKMNYKKMGFKAKAKSKSLSKIKKYNNRISREILKYNLNDFEKDIELQSKIYINGSNVDLQ